jgi:hypothetical protein
VRVEYFHLFLSEQVRFSWMKASGPMPNLEWQELYKAALLELSPEDLPRRIGEARAAIQQRIAELRQEDSDFAEEARELDDALHGLRVLALAESKPPSPAQFES